MKPTRFTAANAVVIAALLLIGIACSTKSDTATPATAVEVVADPGAPTPSSGCENGDRSLATPTEATFTSGGAERTYLLGVPSSNDGVTPMPLVLDLHGANETVTRHDAVTTMTEKGEQEGFVTVSPQGIGTLNVLSANHGGRDAVFIDELLDALEARLCLDTSRFYLTGYSGGAMMTAMLACDSDRFAAAAPVGAQALIPDCGATRPVPVRAFQGTGDEFGPPFDGGVSFDTATAKMRSIFGADTVDELFREHLQALGDTDRLGSDVPGVIEIIGTWATRNGCADSFTEQRVASDTRLLAWDGCPEGAPAELYVIDGGGHTWPGSELHAQLAVLGPTTSEIDATDVMWEFFERFHL